jgi:hypothetical protein
LYFLSQRVACHGSWDSPFFLFMAALAWVAALMVVPHAAGVSLRWPWPVAAVAGARNHQKKADSSAPNDSSSLFGGAAAADRVARLPGQPPGVPESQLYAGTRGL